MKLFESPESKFAIEEEDFIVASPPSKTPPKNEVHSDENRRRQKWRGGSAEVFALLPLTGLFRAIRGIAFFGDAII